MLHLTLDDPFRAVRQIKGLVPFRVPEKRLHPVPEYETDRSWPAFPPIAWILIGRVEKAQLDARGRPDHIEEPPGRKQRRQEQLEEFQYAHRSRPAPLRIRKPNRARMSSPAQEASETSR